MIRDAGCMMQNDRNSGIWQSGISKSLYKKWSSNESRLPMRVVIHLWSSSIEGRLPSKVKFHQRSSSLKGCLPWKVVFLERSSSIMVVFNQRSSSIKGRLPSKVVFLLQAAPELPLKWIKQYELGRLDNKLTGTDRQTGGRTGPRIESGWRSD